MSIRVRDEITRVLSPTDEAKSEVEALVADQGFQPAWYTNLNADASLPAWFFARREGRLVGFLTVFDPSGQAAEVSAFVAPEARRQGVFSALWDEAQRHWTASGRRWLLVVDRTSPSGTLVAQRRGVLTFTEATLGLEASQRPPFAGLPGNLTLAPGTKEDVDAILAVQERTPGEGEGDYRSFLENVLADPRRRLFVLENQGRLVGTAGLGLDGDVAELFGLAIAPDVQGRGWGRALVQGVLELGHPGVREFRLEVDSTNHRAERLYRSLGFTDREVIDYYEVPS